MTQTPWRFISAVMITGFLVVAQIYAVLPLMTEIVSDLQVTDAQASVIPTAFGLAYAFGFFIFGPIADKVDRMSLLVAGLIALAGTTLLAAQISTYWSLMGTRVLQGLAAASFPATALALVSEKTPPKDQPFAISMLGFAFLSSAPLSQLTVKALGLSLSTLMGTLAGLYTLCAIAIYVTGTDRSSKTALTSDHVPEAERPNAQAAVSQKRFPPIAAAIIAPSTVLLCLVTFHTLCQSLASSGAPLDPQVLRLVGFPPLLICFLAPLITKRFGPAVTASCGLLVTALGMACAGGGLNLALCSIIVSSGVALAVPGLIAAVTFWSSVDVRARALAIYTFCLFTGASLAPVLANALYQIDAIVGFTVPAVATLFAACTLYITRPTHQTSHQAAPANRS